MARAAIELSGDIREFLPLLSRKIEGYAYFPGSQQATFNKDNLMIVMSPREISIYGVENEAAARNIMGWLKNIFADTET